MAIEDYMLTCPSKKILGIDCFGCGMQRATLLLFEGKFQAAYQMYPPIYTMLLFFLFVALNFIDKKRNYNSILIGLAIINAIMMVVSYFYKHSYYFK